MAKELLPEAQNKISLITGFILIVSQLILTSSFAQGSSNVCLERFYSATSKFKPNLNYQKLILKNPKSLLKFRDEMSKALEIQKKIDPSKPIDFVLPRPYQADAQFEIANMHDSVVKLIGRSDLNQLVDRLYDYKARYSLRGDLPPRAEFHSQVQSILGRTLSHLELAQKSYPNLIYREYLELSYEVAFVHQISTLPEAFANADARGVVIEPIWEWKPFESIHPQELYTSNHYIPFFWPTTKEIGYFEIVAMNALGLFPIGVVDRALFVDEQWMTSLTFFNHDYINHGLGYLLGRLKTKPATIHIALSKEDLSWNLRLINSIAKIMKSDPKRGFALCVLLFVSTHEYEKTIDRETLKSVFPNLTVVIAKNFIIDEITRTTTGFDGNIKLILGPTVEASKYFNSDGSVGYSYLDETLEIYRTLILQ